MSAKEQENRRRKRRKAEGDFAAEKRAGAERVKKIEFQKRDFARQISEHLDAKDVDALKKLDLSIIPLVHTKIPISQRNALNAFPSIPPRVIGVIRFFEEYIRERNPGEPENVIPEKCEDYLARPVTFIQFRAALGQSGDVLRQDTGGIRNLYDKFTSYIEGGKTK